MLARHPIDMLTKALLAGLGSGIMAMLMTVAASLA